MSTGGGGGPGVGIPVVLHELSRRRRIGILLICTMSLLIVGLDVTIVNVALPSIGRAFDAPVSGLQWTVDAYTLVLASLLILSGSTADRFGRKRMFTIGLLLFVLGSLACSLAPSLPVLVVFRMVQAVGGSMLTPVAMSIITNTFTDPRERAQAIGVWGTVVGISMALGPVIGGLLVGSAGWRSIFWINIPIGLCAATLTVRYVPESRAPHPRRLDPIGQVLVIALLASLTYGIIEAPHAGWTSDRILAAFVLAAVSLAGIVLYEPRRHEPLINLRFFRSVPFSGAALVATATSAAFGGFIFLNTLYLQESRGLSALEAGLDTLPVALMAIVVAPLSGRMVSRHGPRLPLFIAGVGLVAGTAMLSTMTTSTPFSWLFLAYLVFGGGFGFVNVPVTHTGMSGMPRAQAGVAAAITTTSRQVGQTLGVAIVGAIVASGLHGSLATGLPVASHGAWLTLTGCGGVVLILGLVSTSARARASAQRTARELNPEAIIEPGPVHPAPGGLTAPTATSSL